MGASRCRGLSPCASPRVPGERLGAGQERRTGEALESSPQPGRPRPGHGRYGHCGAVPEPPRDATPLGTHGTLCCWGQSWSCSGTPLPCNPKGLHGTMAPGASLLDDTFPWGQRGHQDPTVVSPGALAAGMWWPPCAPHASHATAPGALKPVCFGPLPSQPPSCPQELSPGCPFPSPGGARGHTGAFRGRGCP